mgnify:CR=1 FL=1
MITARRLNIVLSNLKTNEKSGYIVDAIDKVAWVSDSSNTSELSGFLEFSIYEIVLVTILTIRTDGSFLLLSRILEE